MDDGRPYIAQNWDWISEVDVVIMGIMQSDASDHVALTEAGIVGGKIGVNEHGIGMTLNGLVSAADGEQTFRLPYHVRFRDVLNATRLSEEIGALLETDRTCSANVLLGSETGQLVDLKVLPESANYLYPAGDVLTHANHIKGFEGESKLERILPDTLVRDPRLRRLLADKPDALALSTTDIKNALRSHVDHPTSICRHWNPTFRHENRARRASAPSST